MRLNFIRPFAIPVADLAAPLAAGWNLQVPPGGFGVSEWSRPPVAARTDRIFPATLDFL